MLLLLLLLRKSGEQCSWIADDADCQQKDVM
jgi:hypothetical protein